jgi:F0F1-type ATP synthase membrane subunit c/vacuolar-type H+-ATPase subunit K
MFPLPKTPSLSGGRVRRRPGLTPGVVALGAALLAGAALIGAVPGFGQVAIGEALAGGVVVRGRIADVFGDRFLIEDQTGRVLVEAGGAEKPGTLETGQEVVIEGRLRGRVLEARRITTGTDASPPAAPAVAGGAEARSPAAPSVAGPALATPPVEPRADALATLMRPADAASIRTAIEGAGFSMAGSPVRHDKDTEIPVRDARGRAWVAWLDRFGRLSEVEIVDYDDSRVPDQPSFASSEIGSLVQREGFAPRASAERHRHHFEILAANRRSELVELHVDFAGQIYKQVWVR